ncbi:hypothetical protein E2N92_05540 [Methanofollis formosanus]|uniref:Uncharacterized protein n=1 Tax=Methanofollis formosanus TaxID=299308 RepID=A0A8G1A1Y0_9EURY|nr:hypothetical protein [Methanofollis formosanus]QYZ78926.1 hypothetical protein E2N92_05540 [Methanofollis formosanus]
MTYIGLDDIKDGICHTLSIFVEKDAALLDLEVDERALTHQIACYLKEPFSDWDVDCEYNRRGYGTKETSSGPKRPDIIVHHRNKHENRLIIEAKKNGNNTDDDDKKLKEFTKKSGKYGYDFGILLIIPGKNMPFTLRWYNDGKYIFEEHWPIGN